MDALAGIDIRRIGQGAGRFTPVDYKRGKRPHVPKGAYDPERVQLCVQGMILEEHGSRVGAVLVFVDHARGQERQVPR